MVVDPLHHDYCRLQLVYCEKLCTAKRAEYDVVEYKKENFDRQVRTWSLTLPKMVKSF